MQLYNSMHPAILKSCLNWLIYTIKSKAAQRYGDEVFNNRDMIL